MREKISIFWRHHTHTPSQQELTNCRTSPEEYHELSFAVEIATARVSTSATHGISLILFALHKGKSLPPPRTNETNITRALHIELIKEIRRLQMIIEVTLSLVFLFEIVSQSCWDCKQKLVAFVTKHSTLISFKRQLCYIFAVFTVCGCSALFVPFP